MSQVLQYKGYFGAVEFDCDDRTFYGDVINIRDVIAFEGRTVEELEDSFHKPQHSPGLTHLRSFKVGHARSMPKLAPKATI